MTISTLFTTTLASTLLLASLVSARSRSECGHHGQMFMRNKTILYNNDWGDNRRGQCVDILHEPMFAWEVTWNAGIGNGWNYPAILNGNHGWGMTSHDPRFPVFMKDVDRLQSTWRTQTWFHPMDQGNVAFDIWCSPDPTNWDRHHVEIMVWMNRWRQQPRGGEAIVNTTIDGRRYGVHVAAKPATITFVDLEGRNEVVDLNLKSFLRYTVYASKQIKWKLGEDVNQHWYLHGVEAGFEYKTTNSTKRKYKARTHEYSLTVEHHHWSQYMKEKKLN